MKGLILCAGQGTRFQPYTNIKPKPSIPFLGLPMFYYSLFQLKLMGVTEVVYNTFHLAKHMKQDFEDENVRTRFPLIHESPESNFLLPLNSGGGLHNARKFFANEDHLIICNGDEIIIPHSKNEFKNYLDYFHKKKPLALLLTTEHPEAGKKFGAIWVDDSNKIYGFGKTEPQLPTNSFKTKLKPLHFLGSQILSKEIFHYTEMAHSQKIDNNILYDVLNLTIKDDKPIYAYKINCSWEETGNLKDYLVATNTALNLLSSKNEYLIDFFNFWSKKPTSFQENYFGEFELINQLPNKIILKHNTSIIDKGAVISGFVVLGHYCRILQNTRINNSVIDDSLLISKNLNETLEL